MDKAEAINWYLAIVNDVLNVENYTQEEGDQLCSEGFPDFMGELAMSISDTFSQEERDELATEYFCPGVELEERILWYKALCEAITSFANDSIEDKMLAFLDGTIAGLYDWSDNLYFSLPTPLRETFDAMTTNEFFEREEDNSTLETDVKPFRNFENNN